MSKVTIGAVSQGNAKKLTVQHNARRKVPQKVPGVNYWRSLEKDLASNGESGAKCWITDNADRPRSKSYGYAERPFNLSSPGSRRQQGEKMTSTGGLNASWNHTSNLSPASKQGSRRAVHPCPEFNQVCSAPETARGSVLPLNRTGYFCKMAESINATLGPSFDVVDMTDAKKDGMDLDSEFRTESDQGDFKRRDSESGSDDGSDVPFTPKANGRGPKMGLTLSSMFSINMNSMTLQRMISGQSFVSKDNAQIPFFIDPHHTAKVLWDLFCGVLIIYSVINIPLAQSFLAGHFYLAMGIVDTFIDICFIVDIVLTFFTAYSKDNKLIIHRRLISQRYLRTWFLPDLISSVPFDSILSLIVTGQPYMNYDGFRSLKLVKVLRTIKVLRLLKLLRVFRLIRKFQTFQSDIINAPAITNLMWRMASIMFFSHLFACGWYLVTGCGDPDVQDELGWDFCGHSHSISSQYLASLYWVTATMMGVGYGDISASTLNERAYALIVMLSGSVAFGMVITTVSILVGSYNPYKTEYSNRMNEVKEYMLERRIPPKLQSKIRHHFQYVYQRISVFDESSIHSHLTPNLYQMLILNKHKKVTTQLQFFKDAMELSSEFVCMALQTLKPMQAQAGEDIAVQGDISEEVYFMCSGQVNALRYHSKSSQPTLIALFKEGHDFGLEGLVLHRDVPCTYRAMTSCDLLFFDQHDFDHIMDDFPEMSQFIFLKVKQHVSNMRKVLSSGNHNVDGTNTAHSLLLGVEVIPVSLLEINPVSQSHHGSQDKRNGENNRMVRILKEGVVAVFDENINKVVDQQIKYEKDTQAWIFGQHKLLDPYGTLKGYWDCWVGLLTVYSVIQLPVQLGFDIKSKFIVIFGFFVDFSFLLDCFLTFFTALELSPDLYSLNRKEIAMVYLKSWFVFDLLSSIPWELMENSGMNLIRIVRIGKFMKLFRIVRFFRRLEEILLESGLNTYIERSIRLTVTLSFIGHMLGCFFHLVALTGSGSTWADADGLGTLTERYCASVYWAFTTMTTVGYGDILPTRDLERIFVTGAMFVGATVFGYIVGTVSNLMAQMNHAKRFAPELLSMVTAYLQEQSIEFNLTLSIKRHLQYVFETRSAFNENYLLRKMPRHLRRQTLLYARRDFIKDIKIFRNQPNAFVAHIAHYMEPLYCIANNFIYKDEDDTNGIYFLTDGIVELVKVEKLATLKKHQAKSTNPVKQHSYLGSKSGTILRFSTSSEQGNGHILKHVVEAGGVFGYKSFLGMKTNDIAARSFVDCCLFLLPREEIMYMNERHVSLARKLKASLQQILEEQKAQEFGLESSGGIPGKDALQSAVANFKKVKSSRGFSVEYETPQKKFFNKKRSLKKSKYRDQRIGSRSEMSSSFYERSIQRADFEGLGQARRMNSAKKLYRAGTFSKKTKVVIAPESSVKRKKTLDESKKECLNTSV